MNEGSVAGHADASQSIAPYALGAFGVTISIMLFVQGGRWARVLAGSTLLIIAAAFALSWLGAQAPGSAVAPLHRWCAIVAGVLAVTVATVCLVTSVRTLAAGRAR